MTVAGIDIGGTKLAAVALARDEVVARTHAEHAIAGPASLVDAIADAVAQLDAALTAEGRAPVRALGLGIAAWLTRDRGTVTWAAHLGVRDFALRAALEERLGMPVVIDNDADAYLLGEVAHGAARGAETALLLALGTGVGGAYVADGRPLTGAHGLAGELGHVTVDEAGPRCSCTARGCIEAYAGGNALAREAALVPAAVGLAEAEGAAPTARHLELVARAGDAAASAAYERAGWAVAAGLRRLLPAFDPDVIVLGGRVLLAASDLIVPVVERELAAMVPLQGVPQPRRIVLAELGGHAGAIGAAVRAAALPTP